MNSNSISQRVSKSSSTQKSAWLQSQDPDASNLPIVDTAFSGAFQSMKSTADQSSQTMQLSAYQRMADMSSRVNAVVQRKGGKTNNRGLPDQLKEGVEQLSGISMDDVRVHYNSSQPQQLDAHAYAQGSDIHLGPGQEKHLAHEAWHVVQQREGRVKSTMQMKGNLNVNNDEGLEAEADLMGEKALKQGLDLPESSMSQSSPVKLSPSSNTPLIQRMIIPGVAKTSKNFDANHLVESMSKQVAVNRWQSRNKSKSTVVTKEGFKKALRNQRDELKEDIKNGSNTELALDPGEGMMVTEIKNATKKQQPYTVDTADSVIISASPDKSNPKFAFIYHLDETEYSFSSANEEGFPALGSV